MAQSAHAQPSIARAALIFGALSGAVTLVNLILGYTVVAAPSPDGPTPDAGVADVALWSEFAVSAALAAASGFFLARRGGNASQAVGAGALTGAVGALVAVILNIAVFALGSMAALNVYSAQLGEVGPGATGGGGFIPYVIWIVTIFGLAGLTSGMIAGAIAGLLGGVIGGVGRGHRSVSSAS